MSNIFIMELYGYLLYSNFKKYGLKLFLSNHNLDCAFTMLVILYTHSEGKTVYTFN